MEMVNFGLVFIMIVHVGVEAGQQIYLDQLIHGKELKTIGG